MLEAITMVAARKVGASVLTVDIQDLMELTPDMFNSKGAGTFCLFVCLFVSLRIDAGALTYL
jgi:hypothetical protein